MRVQRYFGVATCVLSTAVLLGCGGGAAWSVAPLGEFKNLVKYESGPTIISSLGISRGTLSEATALAVTPEGGMVLVGTAAESADEDTDALAVRLDYGGAVACKVTFRGKHWDKPAGVTTSKEGDFVLAGYSKRDRDSSDVDEGWIIKADNTCEEAWRVAFDASKGFVPLDVALDGYGRYVVAGRRKTGTKDVSEPFLAVIDSEGKIAWQKTFPGAVTRAARRVLLLEDGGYLLAGSHGSHSDDENMWVARVDSKGELVWEKHFGTEADSEYLADIAVLPDGGFILVGTAHLSHIASRRAFLFRKVNAKGKEIWSKLLDRSDLVLPRGRAVAVLEDGSAVLLGTTQLPDARATRRASPREYWVLAGIRPDGGTAWLTVFGDEKGRSATAMGLAKLPEGRLAILGFVNPMRGDPMTGSAAPVHDEAEVSVITLRY